MCDVKTTYVSIFVIQIEKLQPYFNYSFLDTIFLNVKLSQLKSFDMVV